ncbi:Cytoplasmic tRNA 2-thiolation protein 2 [Tieghemiomyces parasiticus]|uniref:Cytoplasmic tRNA 2-thiolation protein 2 n=1 Tax=Tieghemiomyces parasiticus TaxID=78921 RepID=A0A9W8DJH2_9FUNG|nr:Cytoplasmic tRNA 2-thiolation protein 2 [Tieghemiomyces parasiticus]
MCDQPTTVSLGRQPKRSANVCYKCNTAKPAVKIRHTFYCQPCFLIAFNNKFRSRIGKAFKLSTTKKPRVLLALSGGSASRALLDLVSNFSRLDYEKEDKQKFEKFVVCHVDESCLFPNSASNAAKIQEYVDAAGIEFSRVGLEEVFTSDDAGHVLEVSPQSSFISGDVRAHVVASDASPLDKLLALFTATKKLSAQEDLLGHLRSTLLLREARRHNCTLVLLGDTCTRLAIRVITMTSRGRGAALPVELNDTSAWLGG